MGTAVLEMAGAERKAGQAALRNGPEEGALDHLHRRGETSASPPSSRLFFPQTGRHLDESLALVQIDSICSKRSSSSTESESERRIKTSFMTEMQGVSTPQSRVLLLGATNTPYNLDEAIRRRFEKVSPAFAPGLRPPVLFRDV